jgi:uncharacterized membrane protein (DUF4010 family)
MISAPPVTSVALLLALSLFLGLAFEDFFARTDTRRPGGIRTFPMLALGGGVLYLFDPVRFIPFTAGLLVLGGWLVIFYRHHVGQHDETGEPNVGLVVPLVNIHAYLLGAITLVLPHWMAVGTTVAVVLLLTSRDKLHALARGVDVKEIVIAAQFLILTGIILPLLPDQPVTTLTSITPHQAWLALVVISALSYVSYLAQRYWKAAASGLWMAALGGLYSSTATTVVLARQAKAGSVTKRQAQAGIALATAIMYLRLLVIVAVFNRPLALTLTIPLGGLALAALAICALQYWFSKPVPGDGDADAPTSALQATGANPLQLGPAALFAALFVLVSLVSQWITAQFGISGVYSLAAVVGITDIDPFVLNLAQGGTSGMSNVVLAAAILIAASSNNVLKAAYAAGFAGGRETAGSAAALVLLAIAGVGIALATGGFR